jgi:hypothetical protein
MSRAGQLKSCTAGHITSLIAEMCDFCRDGTLRRGWYFHRRLRKAALVASVNLSKRGRHVNRRERIDIQHPWRCHNKHPENGNPLHALDSPLLRPRLDPHAASLQLLESGRAGNGHASRLDVAVDTSHNGTGTNLS